MEILVLRLKIAWLVSRAIEHNLDREEEDFSLEVMSAGVSEPLKITQTVQKKYWQKS